MSKERNHISVAFGEVIRELRKEHNLTQEKLAELSELHTNYISLIERGQRKSTINSIFQLATAFETKPHLLVKKVEEQL